MIDCRVAVYPRNDSKENSAPPRLCGKKNYVQLISNASVNTKTSLHQINLNPLLTQGIGAGIDEALEVGLF